MDVKFKNANGTGFGCIELQEIMAEIWSPMHPVLSPLHYALCFVSLVGCVLNLTVMCRRSVISRSIRVFWITLEAANMVFAVLYIILWTTRFAFPYQMVEPWYAYFSILVDNITWSALLLQVWLTVAVSIWRFLAVSHPLKARSILTKRRAQTFTFFLTTMSCFPGLFRGCSQQVVAKTYTLCDENNYKNYTVFESQTSPWALKVPEVSNAAYVTVAFLYYLLPCTCFAVLTIGLIWSLISAELNTINLMEGQVRRRRKSRSSSKTTVVLLIFVASFLIAYAIPALWRTGLFVEDRYPQGLPYPWNYIFKDHILGLMINSSSFFAYYFIGSSFRKAFHELVGQITKAFIKPVVNEPYMLCRSGPLRP